MTFKLIRNYLEKYKKEEIIDRCYHQLAVCGNDVNDDIWIVFLIMKWTYLYAERKFPYLKFEEKNFIKLYSDVRKLNDPHSTNFVNANRWDKVFQILYYQQFYLQKSLCKEKFATQMKLYNNIDGKYDINKSFTERSGLTTSDILFFFQTIWLVINAQRIDPDTKIKFNGYITKDIYDALIIFKGKELTDKFLTLVTLDPSKANETISKIKSGVTKEELQSMERTFFTMFPFQVYKNNIKFIHESVFKYTANYFIYDFMKLNDRDNFLTEFGGRFEKYIDHGIKEMNLPVKREHDLKKLFPRSKVVDFVIDENILIECKAIEVQPITAIIPTDELIYNSLKDSIFKAYNKQMLQVIKNLNTKNECFGIILTYKDLYWSCYSELFDIGKKDIADDLDITFLPPENVFIIDYYVWDKIVQLVKDHKVTLIDVLKKAKLNNSSPATRKQLFDAHLDEYELEHFNLSYLTTELNTLDSYKNIDIAT